jgi:DNA-binding transcriptional LysR family regulator
MAAYPRVALQLEATNRRVDPIGEAVDVAIRVRPPPLEDSELVMRILADRAQGLVASPRLIGQFGKPQVPADLGDWPSLGLGTPPQDFAWHLSGADGAQASLHHAPRFITTDMIALRSAALAGVGAVQLPLMLLQQELASGALVRLLPDWEPPREIIHAVFPSRRGLLPSVRTLIDFLVRRFAELTVD